MVVVTPPEITLNRRRTKRYFRRDCVRRSERQRHMVGIKRSH
jgi:hypothetical protein